MTNGLRITGLSAAFGTHRVLDDVSLSVAPGETLVLFGPSGAGKTTLLRAIAGVEPAAHGRIEIAGRDMTHTGPERRGIGVAFQNFALYPHMTAYRNIASPLEARRLPAAEIDARVKDIARLLKIDHVLGHMPRQLSNGQKQRTALARALVGRPGVLLLDDPLRNVDAKLRYEMRMELPRLLRGADREAATIYVSQDYREAMALADRIAVLIDGRIVQEGAPETIYDMPATIDVARLFGDPPVNLVPCRPRAEGGDLAVEAFGIAFRLGRDLAAAGRDCLLGLRPEDIAVHREAHPSAVPATVIAATPLQERLVLLLRRPDGVEVLANVAGAAPAANSPVWMAPRTDRALLYDAGSGARLAYSAAKRAEVAA